MKVLAFLQNAWFPPNTKPHYIKKYIEDDVFRRCVLARSYTGRRILRVFGEKFFLKTVWQNVCTEVGTTSDYYGKPDHGHVKETIIQHKPDVILTFGQLALSTINYIDRKEPIGIPVFCTKHPNARYFSDEDLQKFCDSVKLYIRSMS